MKMFGLVGKKDYSVQEMYTAAPMSWEMISSSYGVEITSPELLDGAVIINRASVNAYFNPNDKEVGGDINQDTSLFEYSLYRSIKHLFYDRGYFLQGSTFTTSSVNELPNDFFVVSVSQTFYGDRIKPGSFVLSIDEAGKEVLDDSAGNLFVSQSGVGTYVGNIFYTTGIAVIKHNTASFSTDIGPNGLKLISGSVVYVDYESEVKYLRHEAVVTLKPTEYNISAFNPSMKPPYQVTGQMSSSLVEQNIKPVSGSDMFSLYSLMASKVIKPYVTTIGLYNDQYELLAVAKLSHPIQRTFDINQIFIVRFDT